MKKTIKRIAFAIAVSISFYIVGCTDSIDTTPDRTAATEQAELNEAIAILESGGYNVDTTDLGIYYVMEKQGSGPLPQQGDSCYLIYIGYFLDGSIFDASYYYYGDSIWHVKYKNNSLISGFTDGIGLLNKGAEATIIIPSSLAYGEYGYDIIPPYKPIVFSLKMRDLKQVE